MFFSRIYKNGIAVDFDGTLFKDNWPDIGKPRKGLIRRLIKRQRQGSKIILWTCRQGERLQAAVDKCREHGLIFDAVNDNPYSEFRYLGASRKIPRGYLHRRQSKASVVEGLEGRNI